MGRSAVKCAIATKFSRKITPKGTEISIFFILDITVLFSTRIESTNSLIFVQKDFIIEVSHVARPCDLK